MSSEEKQLPKGWIVAPLAQNIQPRGEKVSPSHHPEARFIGMDNVESHSTRILETLPASAMKSSAARFDSGDVLYGRLRPYLNKVAQPNFDGLASAEFIVFPDTQLIRSCFLRHRLNAADFVSFASHLNEGDRPRVSFDQIGEFEILIPPPLEQDRIVAKIEELFSELDQGVESLKTARAQLHVYRQAVLKHAFEGKLTAQWREENKDKLEQPEQLLGRIKRERAARYERQLEEWRTASNKWAEHGKSGQKPKKPKTPAPICLPTEAEIESLPQLPNSWLWIKVQALLVEPPTNGHSVKDRASGFPVLRLTAIKTERLDLSEAKNGDWEREDALSYLVKEGDFLLARGNGSKRLVGRGGLVPAVEHDVAYPDTMIRLRVDPKAVDGCFFSNVWNSRLLRRQIEAAARTTAGIYKINQGHIRNFVVPLCSSGEQVVVVDRLSAALSAIDTIESKVNSQLHKADTLRQSVLKEAFAGQLVAQDLSDEPGAFIA